MFLCSFQCSFRVFRLLYLHNLQCPLFPFLLTHIVSLNYLLDGRPCASSSTFLSSGPFVLVPLLFILRMVKSILQRSTAQMFILLMRFLLSLVSRFFFVRLRYSYLILFFHLYLFDGVRFQYSQVLVIFLFSPCSDFSWFGSSIPSVICLFLLLITSVALFSMPNSILISWLYILIVCIRVSNSVSSFCKKLDGKHVHQVINLIFLSICSHQCTS